MRISVVGSGFGGLSAAIRLQAQGHQVTIVEKLEQAGGSAFVFRQDGFTFDAGPTIITAPWLLDELFALTGRTTADYIRLVRLDPCYNIRFDDGSVFRYSGDSDALLAQVRAFSLRDEPGYLEFRRRAGTIFDAGMPLIDQPFDTLGPMLRALPAILRTRAYRSVATMANSYLSDERLRQVFSFHPLLVGGNPYSASSMYALIHKLEQQWGVFFCMGGTGALVHSLVRAFEELGGSVRYDHEVCEILLESGGRTTGVRCTNGETIPADAVVFNGDLVQAYRTLINPRRYPRARVRRLERLRHSMSLVVIYFGTDRRYPDLAHHEIIMGPRYRGLLDDIFKHKVLADDFSLYLHRPTATDPSLAPADHDAWYVLSPVPHLGSGIDWEVAGERYRDRIMAYLEARYLPGLSRHIVSERRIDPRYFEGTLNRYLGNAFGPQPILTQSAYFRPHIRDRAISNLYFCGAGTHPGAGLPGVISSGKIVARMIGPAVPSSRSCLAPYSRNGAGPRA